MSSARNVLWIMVDQLRWDYLSCYGHPRLHTPEPRPAGRARGAFRSRLRSIADLRTLAHELLYRPLRAQPRRDVERVSSACRRTHAGRSSTRHRRGLRPGRQDPHDPRRRGHEAAGDRARIGYRHPYRGVRLHPRSSATTACIRRAITTRIRPMTTIYARTGWTAPPLGGMGELRRGRRRDAAVGLADALRRPAGACARGAFRDALSHPARHRFHGRRRARGAGFAIFPTSSRTGPISRPRRTTTCTVPTTSSPRCAPTPRG